MTRFRILLATAAMVGAAPLHANAAALTAAGILSQFNAVFATTFNSNSDVEGRFVANELVTGATLYNNPNPAAGASSFAAVNAITVDSSFHANVNNSGNADIQGANNGSFSFNGGHLVSTPAFTIADFTTPLNNLSSTIRGLTANSAVNSSDPNSFTFVETPDANGRAVFRLSASLLQTAATIKFSGSATTILIDVTGGSYTDTSNFDGASAAFVRQHVIWNFLDATTVSLRNFEGSILAKNAALSNTSAVEGFTYAKSFNGGGELHNFPFLGTLPSDPSATPVPEPGSVAMLAVGMMGLGLLRRRRQPGA